MGVSRPDDAGCLDATTLRAFADGTLGDDATTRARLHIDGCESCRGRVSDEAQLLSTAQSGKGGAATQGPTHRAVGRYLLLRFLGAGAMGVVHEAYDPELRRRVALKLLRADARQREPSSAGQQRLLREAQAMAQLQHPDVIAVYDFGATDDEVFLAMELVEGGTLRGWLSKPRTRDDIVAIFLQAARGLVAAHAAGLIHRDFKPDNVLVGKDGRVRVTDFGLARAVSAEGIAEPIDGPADLATRTGALVGTPAYMAPEQFLGGTVDERTDQFAFCVALHEALLGERPFTGDTIREIARATVAAEWKPPRKLPRRLARLLQRGLQKKPEARFPSMDALAVELDGASARAWRNRAVTGGLSLAAVALTLAWVQVRGRHERLCQGAEKQLAGIWDPPRADAIHAAFRATKLAFAEDAFHSVAAALDRRASRWAELDTDACVATRVRGDQTEEMLSLRVLCLDRRKQELRALTDLLARPDAALVEQAPSSVAHLSSLEDCADLQALSANRRAPAKPELRQKLSLADAALAEVKALDAAGRYDAVLAPAKRAVELARASDDRRALAEALQALGAAQTRNGLDKEAQATLAEAALTAEAAGADVIKVLAQLGWTRLVGLTKFNAAHEGARRAAATIDRLGGDPELRIALYITEAQVLEREGRYADQLAQLDQAIALDARLPHREPLDRALLHAERSAALLTLGRKEDALAESQKALSMREPILGSRHPQVAVAVGNMAIALYGMARYEEALHLLDRACAIWRDLGTQDLNVVTTLDARASALEELGRFDEADKGFAKALTMTELVRGPKDPQLGVIWQHVGELRARQKRNADARAAYQRAIAITEAAYGKNHPDLTWPLVGLAELARKEGRFAEATAFARRALANAEQSEGANHPDVAPSLKSLGETALAQRDVPGAVKLLERANQVLEAHPDDPRDLAAARFGLARALWLAGQKDRATQLATRSADGYTAAHAAADATDVRRWLDAHR